MTTETIDKADEQLLLLDDSLDNLIVLNQVIHAALPSLTVLPFQNPTRALEFLGRSHVTLALVDVQIPGMNGIEFCRAVKNNTTTSHIPVLLITSHSASPKMKAEGLEAGADDFLMRPIDNLELISRIKVGIRMAKAEARLRNLAKESERQYKQIFEKSVSALIIMKLLYDASGSPYDVLCLKANGSVKDHIGFLPDEIEGKKISALLPGGLPSPWLASFQKMVTTQKTIQFTGLVAPLGRTMEVSAYPLNEAMFITNLSDITLQKRTELENHKLRLVMEQAGEAFCITDKNGTIEYINPAFAGTFGYERDELLGATPTTLQQQPVSPEIMESIKTTLAGGGLWKGRLEGRHASGACMTLDTAISPIRTQQGETTNYVVSCFDITNEIRLREELRQAQKMESIGRLAGGIAHDFNNILGALMGYTELLRDHLRENREAQECAEGIEEATTRAKSLVNQILTFSRRGVTVRSLVDVGSILQEATKLLKEILPSTITFSSSIQEPSLVVLADSTQIHQVIINLCTNAYHAMERGHGRISVELEKVVIHEEQALRHGVEAGEFVRLTVSDTGCGMDPIVQEKAFEPFFTTKEVGEGTGLGLSTVQGIISDLKGFITLNSQRGEGTTFQIHIPRSEKQASSISSNKNPKKLARQGAGERILIIDDEPQILRVVGTLLRKNGYVVTTTDNPLAALELFQSSPDSFDIVLSDQTMPRMTGFELGKKLLHLRPGLPVILLTGFSEIINEAEVVKAGFHKLLFKPVSLPELKLEIQAALYKEAS